MEDELPHIACSSAVRASPPTPAPRLEATGKMKGDVVRSWEKIQELGTTVVGERVYKIFFDIVPEAMNSFPLHVRLKYQEWMVAEEEGVLHNSAALRNLFAKVLNAIGSTVAGLQESDKLVPLLTSLGMRHIGYRVDEAFWPALGKAMNQTLRELLGDGFTLEVENAWNIVYGFMSQIMIEGLRAAKEAAKEAMAWGGESAISQSSSAREQQSFEMEDRHGEVHEFQKAAGDVDVQRWTSGSTASTRP